MRPVWRGMISFGLVNIPVGLQPATQDTDVSFHLLHEKDHGRIKNKRVCTKCGEEVPYPDIVRGFEYEKGSYVVLTDEDLKGVPVASNDTIAIDDFVDPSGIDPMYFEKPYYIQPDKKAGKAYGLLYEALKETGKVGIAKITFRTRERLAAVRAGEKTLMLYTMHLADEIRAVEAPASSEGQVNTRELRMAETLIDSMTGEFEPQKYRDDYAEALMKLIEAKKTGKAQRHEEAREQATEVMDLMAYLKASIEQSGKKPRKTPVAEKKRRAKTAAA